ncbi:MAG: glycine--tRNA ligase [Dehalococcoidia bacterium]
MEKIVSLCKRRGFIFQSSEIYGGMSACWDYGPIGVELKRNVKEAWWRSMVKEREDIVGIDASILMHRSVWKASGHEEGFADLLRECKGCNQRWRADHLEGEVCPDCGGELTEGKMFNLMFKTFAGPIEGDNAIVYLRPETAQGIFVNFANVMETTRKKPPFGIAQIGKSFRNEITTGNFIFRCREFEQMEMEFFVKPGTEGKWYEYWLDQRFNWYLNLGIKKENLRMREHAREELAHYARACSDVEYLFPIGWSEIEGIASRGDFDLTQHSKFSGKDLSYFDAETKEKYMPCVIEPSSGVDRNALAFLIDAYDEEPDKDEIRTVLHFHPDIAPVKVAILPLSKKENLSRMARDVHALVRKQINSQYDDTQSIGRRYRRQDEIGTPLSVTVDFESLEDNAVTIRDRDSMKQIRVPVAVLVDTLNKKLSGESIEVLPPGGKLLGAEGK